MLTFTKLKQIQKQKDIFVSNFVNDNNATCNVTLNKHTLQFVIIKPL